MTGFLPSVGAARGLVLEPKLASFPWMSHCVQEETAAILREVSPFLPRVTDVTLPPALSRNPSQLSLMSLDES